MATGQPEVVGLHRRRRRPWAKLDHGRARAGLDKICNQLK
jgi:hypothetical protein